MIAKLFCSTGKGSLSNFILKFCIHEVLCYARKQYTMVNFRSIYPLWFPKNNIISALDIFFNYSVSSLSRWRNILWKPSSRKKTIVMKTYLNYVFAVPQFFLAMLLILLLLQMLQALRLNQNLLRDIRFYAFFTNLLISLVSDILFSRSSNFALKTVAFNKPLTSGIFFKLCLSVLY